MARVYSRLCEGRLGRKHAVAAELHANRPRLFQTMVHAVAADTESAVCQRAVLAQKEAVNKVETSLDIAIARAREIYVERADIIADGSVTAAAVRLDEEYDALKALRRERDIARVAQLLWMREAKLMLRELSKK